MSASPRIRTTVVGSYPVPDWLVAAPSEQALIDATRVVIATQEQAGVDVVCDGELYRFDVNHPETNGMIEYFVRPMQGVRHEHDVRRSDRLPRRCPGCAFAPGRRASSRGRSRSGTLDLPLACQRAAGARHAHLQVHRHRPAHAGQDAARPPLPRHAPSWRTRSPTCSPSRCVISTPTSSSSTRPTCPAIRTNGSGRHRRSTASSTRCKTTPAVHLCFGNYGGQSVQHGTWEQLMRYLNALHADHVVLECAHRPPEELAVFKELQARDRLRPRRRSTSRRPRSSRPTRSRARSSAPRRCSAPAASATSIPTAASGC